jgi:hypothetical protein
MMQSVADRIGKQQPRLSQWPAKAVGSAGDDAIAFAESIGWDDETGQGFYDLDEWQRYCIRGALSEDPAARLCAMVVLILVARQNGKNVILEVIELYAFYVLDLPYILHTAHLQETTADHMDRLWSAIESDERLSKITRRVVANGKERLYRTDKRCQIRFRTRSKKIGRGGSPQLVAFDEALYLTGKQINALLPSLAAQSMRGDAPILIYTSSAPTEDSEVLPRLRQSILDGQTPDAFYAEWSAELTERPGESRHAAMERLADDFDAWLSANPGMGVRIAAEWVQVNERSTMSLEGFLTERLGVVFNYGHLTGPLPLPVWDRLADRSVSAVSNRTLAVAASPVDMGPQWVAIGGAGRTSDGRTVVGVVPGCYRQGMAWVVPELVGMWRKDRVPVRVGPGPERALVGALREAGVEVVEVSAGEVAAATTGLIAAAHTEPFTLAHPGQAELGKALQHADVRPGADGAVSWVRRSEVDIAPLAAITVAYGGVTQLADPPALSQIW